MKPGWSQNIPKRALIIEVTSSEGLVWTALATEQGSVMRELANAPVAATITIHEWHLAKPANPPSMFASCPTWRKIESYPWRLGTSIGT